MSVLVKGHRPARMVDGNMQTFLLIKKNRDNEQTLFHVVQTNPSFSPGDPVPVGFGKSYDLFQINASRTLMSSCSRTELGDMQWNETATSDSLIVTLLFLLLFKQGKPYTFRSHSEMWSDFTACQKNGRGEEGCMKGEGTHRLHAHMQVFASIVHAIRSQPWSC